MQNNQLDTRLEKPKRAYVYCGFSQPNHNILCSTFAALYNAYCAYSRPDHRSSVVPSTSKKIDTGKVVIGLTWSENRNLVSPDQLWVQRALLQPTKPDQSKTPLSERVLWVLYAIAAIVIVATL